METDQQLPAMDNSQFASAVQSCLIKLIKRSEPFLIKRAAFFISNGSDGDDYARRDVPSLLVGDVDQRGEPPPRILLPQNGTVAYDHASYRKAKLYRSSAAVTQSDTSCFVRLPITVYGGRLCMGQLFIWPASHDLPHSADEVTSGLVRWTSELQHVCTEHVNTSKDLLVGRLINAVGRTGYVWRRTLIHGVTTISQSLFGVTKALVFLRMANDESHLALFHATDSRLQKALSHRKLARDAHYIPPSKGVASISYHLNQPIRTRPKSTTQIAHFVESQYKDSHTWCPWVPYDIDSGSWSDTTMAVMAVPLMIHLDRDKLAITSERAWASLPSPIKTIGVLALARTKHEFHGYDGFFPCEEIAVSAAARELVARVYNIKRQVDLEHAVEACAMLKVGRDGRQRLAEWVTKHPERQDELLRTIEVISNRLLEDEDPISGPLLAMLNESDTRPQNRMTLGEMSIGGW